MMAMSRLAGRLSSMLFLFLSLLVRGLYDAVSVCGVVCGVVWCSAVMIIVDNNCDDVTVWQVWGSNEFLDLILTLTAFPHKIS